MNYNVSSETISLFRVGSEIKEDWKEKIETDFNARTALKKHHLFNPKMGRQCEPCELISRVFAQRGMDRLTALKENNKQVLMKIVFGEHLPLV